MIGWIIAGAVILLLLLWVVGAYNKLVRARQTLRNQFSQIDVQLKRRFDLIPNLVETIKGYTKHEKDTLEAVVKARNSYLSATTPEDKMNANNEISGMLSKLMVLSESYPELKANTNFMQMQNVLQETENKIAYARQFYNDAVMKYNNKVETIPTNIIAGLFGFKVENFLAATEAERENVKVQF